MNTRRQLLIALLGLSFGQPLSRAADGAVQAPSPLVVSVIETGSVFAKPSRIEIYADGTVVIKSRTGTELTKHLEVKRVTDLLSFFEQKKVFEVTEATIDQEMKAQGGPIPGPTDYSTTMLWAVSGDRKVRLSRYALVFMVEHFAGGVALMNACVAKVYETAGVDR